MNAHCALKNPDDLQVVVTITASVKELRAMMEQYDKAMIQDGNVWPLRQAIRKVVGEATAQFQLLVPDK